MTEQWKEILINQEASVADALKLIDAQKIKIAIVVDDGGHLVGSITDGDVRRGLLKGYGPQDKLAVIMNRQPKSAEHGATRSELTALMKTHGITVLPVIESGKVVDVVTLEEMSRAEQLVNPVFIMAGGFGTRLRPLTDTCPKPMLPVGEKPILELIIENFMRAGFRNFYISTHYLPEVIMNHFGDGSDMGISIRYVHEDQPLGTGGALGLLPEDIEKLPLIMMNGDILTNLDFAKLLRYHQAHDAVATMCVKEYQYQIPYGVIETEEGVVRDMVEKPVHYFSINTGIYVINPGVYGSVGRQISITMPDLLQKEIDQGSEVRTYHLHDYWLDIGQMKDYTQAQSDVKNINWVEND